MEIITVVRETESLWATAKVAVEIGGLIGAVCAWATLRLRHQRRYLRAVRQLSKLPKYLEKRREAFAVLDWAGQVNFQTLEGQIAKTLQLDLTPQAVCLRAYLQPADGSWLIQANRQLTDSAFRSFAEDLIERLVLLLDSLADLENHRRMVRWTASQEVRAQREQLRSRIAEDRQQIEAHLLLMQQYLAGQLTVDLYTDSTASTMRRVLDEKYRAYQELTAGDLREV
jgi:hypothetical protein